MKLPAIANLSVIFFSVLIPGFVSGQFILQEWKFDDANGTRIGEAANTATPGDWVFSEGLTTQQAVTADGALRVLGGSTGDGIISSVTSGQTVLSTGIYEFSMTVSDFDLSGPGTLAWTQLLLKSGGANLVIFRFQESPTETLRLWLNSGAGGQFFPLSNSNVSSGGVITISGTLNLDDKTITCSIDSPQDNFDVASTGPLAFLSEGDFTGLQLASQFTTSSTSPSDFLDIGEIRLSGPEVIVEPNTWAGYDIGEDGWIDTGDFMGRLYTVLDPWIWSSDLARWVYLPEEHISDSGAWVFTDK